MKIILAMFDTIKQDQMISKEEFMQRLEPYCNPAPISTKDLKSTKYTEQDKEDLKKRHDEYIKVKKCYEDYNFDATDLLVVKKRETE